MPAFDSSNSVAILFGVANYDRAEFFESMPWVANNLRDINDILVDADLFGFARERVIDRLDPTNGSIAEELDSVRERQPGLDTLLVYYCGHGVVEGGRYFITGKDAGRTAAQKLPFEEFERIYLRINAKRKILILDSCFSGRAISTHLADANSVLEANIERLTADEQKQLQIDHYREGTYVLASADRDKPAQAKDDNRELTAFTALLINRLKVGLERTDEERLSLNMIVDAVTADAIQDNLPRPVRSDKFGLGDWRLVGNAAVIKRSNLTADEKLRTELFARLTEIDDKLSADIRNLRELIDKSKDPEVQKLSFWRKLFPPATTQYGIPLERWRRLPRKVRFHLDRQYNAWSSDALLPIAFTGTLVATILIPGAASDLPNLAIACRFFLRIMTFSAILAGFFCASALAFGKPITKSNGAPSTYELNRFGDYDFVRMAIDRPAITLFGLTITRSGGICGLIVFFGIPIFIVVFLSNWPGILQSL